MKRKARVLMFRTHQILYDPRVRIEAETLIENGYDVTLIEWDRNGESLPHEKVYGIDVFRVKNTAFMKIVPYDIFRLRFWWKEAFKMAEKLHAERSFDVIHCHDLDTLPIGVRLKEKHGIKLIYDAAEVWPYMIEGDVPDFIVKHFVRLEKKLINIPDILITVGEKYREYMLSAGAKKNIYIVMNAKRRVVENYVPSGNDVPDVLYIGSLHKNRMIPELINVAKGRKDIKVTIGGRGYLYEKIEELCRDSENIDFIGTVDMDRVIELTLKSDVVYCMFDPEHPITRIGSPNKFFEALVTGRPLMVSEGTYVGELVKKLKCGLVVKADLEGIKKGLDIIAKNPELLEKMGRNALKAAMSGYSWEDQAAVLIRIYQSLME